METFPLIRIAVEKGDLDKLVSLLPGLPKNAINTCDNETGLSLLMIAASGGHAKIVKELISRGSNPGLVDKLGNNVLHYACLYKPKNVMSTGSHGAESYLEMVQSFIQVSSLARMGNVKGETPIFLACQSGNMIALAELLDSNLDVNHKTTQDTTIVDYIVHLDQSDIYQEFFSPHRIDLSAEILTKLYKLGKIEELRSFISQNISLESLNTNGNTILIEAIIKKDNKMIQFLLDNHVSTETTDASGRLPISIATDESIKELLATKASSSSQFLVRSAKDVVVYEDKAYPLLRNNVAWVDMSELRCTRVSKNTPVQHLVDNNLISLFTQIFEKSEENFVIFDFGKEHEIAGIKLFSNGSPYAIKDFSLLVSNVSPTGPWHLVRTLTAECKGPESYKGVKGIEQIFKGFHCSGRFLKFQVDSNYGQFMTAIHQLAFYGVDSDLKTWMSEKGFSQFYNSLVKMGYCELKYLWTITNDEIKRLIKSSPDEFYGFSDAVRELQSTQCPLEFLDFEIYPTNAIMEGRKLPLFTVIGNPGSTGTIEVKFFGGCEVDGTLTQRLVCDKNGGPSKATFSDITIKPAGQYLLEVNYVQNPSIFLAPTEPIVVSYSIKTAEELTHVFTELDDLLNF